MNADPDPHGYTLVWLSGSGSAVKPTRIHNTDFWVEILKIIKILGLAPDPGSSALMILDPGWKNSDPGKMTHDNEEKIFVETKK